MCKCTPNRRTPFCGAPGCEWPRQTTNGIAYPVFYLEDHPTVHPGGQRLLAARTQVRQELERFLVGGNKPDNLTRAIDNLVDAAIEAALSKRGLHNHVL